MRISDWSSDVCSSDLRCSTVASSCGRWPATACRSARGSASAARTRTAACLSRWTAWPRKVFSLPRIYTDEHGSGAFIFHVHLPYPCPSVQIRGQQPFQGGAMSSRQRDGWIATRGTPLRGEVVVPGDKRSEEHTSELQSLMRISYAVFCLKKKKKH